MARLHYGHERATKGNVGRCISWNTDMYTEVLIHDFLY